VREHGVDPLRRRCHRCQAVIQAALGEQIEYRLRRVERELDQLGR